MQGELNIAVTPRREGEGKQGELNAAVKPGRKGRG